MDAADQFRKDTTSFHVTISDIFRLKPNETIELIFLDSHLNDHFETYINSVHPRPKEVRAVEVFTENKKVTFTKGEFAHSLKGTCKWSCFNEPIDFEFHINYDQKDNWFPLQDDYLPEHDEHGLLELMGEPVSIHEFSTTTRLGWRGPAVRFEQLDQLPPVQLYLTTSSVFNMAKC